MEQGGFSGSIGFFDYGQLEARHEQIAKLREVGDRMRAVRAAVRNLIHLLEECGAAEAASRYGNPDNKGAGEFLEGLDFTLLHILGAIKRKLVGLE